MNKKPNSEQKQADAGIFRAPPRSGMSFASLGTHRNYALLSNDILPFSAFVASNTVVQNYPEKYVRPDAGSPRANDKSYNDAQRQGFVYGIMADNKGQHWTRLIMVKPSDQLKAIWDERIGYKFEAITFRTQSAGEERVRVSATYMQGIGNTLLGFITIDEYNKLKQSAWSVNLGESVQGNDNNDAK